MQYSRQHGRLIWLLTRNQKNGVHYPASPQLEKKDRTKGGQNVNYCVTCLKTEKTILSRLAC